MVRQNKFFLGKGSVSEYFFGARIFFVFCFVFIYIDIYILWWRTKFKQNKFNEEEEKNCEIFFIPKVKQGLAKLVLGWVTAWVS